MELDKMGALAKRQHSLLRVHGPAVIASMISHFTRARHFVGIADLYVRLRDRHDPQFCLIDEVSSRLVHAAVMLPIEHEDLSSDDKNNRLPVVTNWLT
jgi:hypothetical protein